MLSFLEITDVRDICNVSYFSPGQCDCSTTHGRINNKNKQEKDNSTMVLRIIAFNIICHRLSHV